METQAIDHVNIRIPDDGVETALRFYRDALGFEPARLDRYRAGERTSFAFWLGADTLLHVRPVEDFQEPSGKNFDHVCLIIDATIDTIKDRLDAHGIEIDREGEPWGGTGRAPAVYVTDPFGYRLELKAGQES